MTDEREYWKAIDVPPAGYQLDCATATKEKAETKAFELVPPWDKGVIIKQIEVKYSDQSIRQRWGLYVVTDDTDDQWLHNL